MEQVQQFFEKKKESLEEEVDNLSDKMREIQESVENGKTIIAEQDCQIDQVKKEKQSLGREKETLQANLRKAQSDCLDY